MTTVLRMYPDRVGGRAAPERRRCRCGQPVRIVHDAYVGMIAVDEEPVHGGSLLINVDTVVGRLHHFDRAAGFQVHRGCRR